MEQWKFDELHDQGLMPDWAYYLQSDKPMWLKFQEQKDVFYKELEQRREQERQGKEESKRKKQEGRERQEQERLIEHQIEKQAETTVKAALNNLLKDFL